MNEHIRIAFRSQTDAFALTGQMKKEQIPYRMARPVDVQRGCTNAVIIERQDLAAVKAIMQRIGVREVEIR